MSGRKTRAGKAAKRNDGSRRDEPAPVVPNLDASGSNLEDDGPPLLTRVTPFTSTPNVTMPPPPSERPKVKARRDVHASSRLDGTDRSRSSSSNRSHASTIRRQKLELEIAAAKRKMELDEEEARLKLELFYAKRVGEETLSKKLQELAAHDLEMSDEEDGICDDSAPSVVVFESSLENRFQPTPYKKNNHDPISQTIPGIMSRADVPEWMRRNEQVATPAVREKITGDIPPAVFAVREKSSGDHPPAVFAPVRANQIDTGMKSSGGDGAAVTCMEKFLARQTVGTKLPVFNGNPGEWPMFLSQFDHSTKLCGLSNHENMLRLQEALKGKAREAVESILGFPGNVNMVMEILQMNFGRDDQIIKTLILKARSSASPRDGRPDTIITFYNVVNNLVSTMQKMKSDAYLNNPSLLEELVHKLSPQMKSSWAMHVLDQNGCSTLLVFVGWLKRWAMAQTYLPVSELQQPSLNDKNNKKPHNTVLNTVATTTTSEEHDPELKSASKITGNCTYCNKPRHQIQKCIAFKALKVNERWKHVMQDKCCFLCLRKGHRTNDCQSDIKCNNESCTGKHHSLLHNPKQKKPEPPEHTENVMCAVAVNEALLKILPVTLTGPSGDVKTYALLDEGSTVTLVDETVANDLGLDGAKIDFAFKGINAVSSKTKSKLVKPKISAAHSDKSYQLQNVKTVPNLTLPVQTVKIGKKRWPHLLDLNIDQYRCADPKILIGQDNIDLIVSREVREGPPNSPFASRTKLGWVLHGNNSYASNKTDVVLLINDRDDELHEVVKNYYKMEQIEDFKSNDCCKSREDKMALKIMEESSVRIDGGWMTGLPWRSNFVKFPETKSQAQRRLNHIERKLAKDEKMAEMYDGIIQDHLRKGYVRELSPEEASIVNEKTNYLAHFPVINPNKQKIRVVWDAAAKSNGVSLNSKLLTGPDLYNPLPAVLFKFRQKLYAASADIEEMFLRIKILPTDCQAQRFLWRGKTYELTVMIFGSVSSPSQAQYIKNRNALEFQDECPEAVHAILFRHYMDDYLDSFNTIEEAERVIKDVIRIHAAGGFRIRNWISSSPELLRTLPEDLVSKDMKVIDTDNVYPVERVLGLRWNPNDDTFNFDVKFHKVTPDVLMHVRRPTKREVLKVISSIFDPLGFISNFHIRGKILLQNIWKSGIGWDDEISNDLDEIWSSWLNQMKLLPEMKIPRFYFFPPNAKLQLHVFCDASSSAYAAVAYLRCKLADGPRQALVMSKTRVAPLKPVTIPRLELMAALIGSRMAHFIRQHHDIDIESTVMWSDSQTVLRWIRSDSNRYHTFVANRLGEIDELTDASQWRWVPSKENVADDATRASADIDLSSSSRWITGPDFLLKSEEQWPEERAIDSNLPTDGVEETLEFVHVAVPSFSSLPDPDRFSSFLKLVRTTAWVMRFIAKCKGNLFNKKDLQKNELLEAEKSWWRHVQWQCYENEMHALTRHKPIPCSSSLKALCPSLDNESIMRINSRMKMLNDKKEQVILGQNHRFTRLLVQHYHCVHMHVGQETVVNEIRQKYWIPALRSLVKSVQFRCPRCKRINAKSIQPMMGMLPDARVTPYVKPFYFTGIDYFGPISVKIGRKYEKRYGVMFSCLTTRAIHLEVAEKLNSDSAVMAIRRLIGLRGKVNTVWSDNGRNLVGAERELKMLVQKLDADHINRQLVSKEVTWNFNPPGAPNMGGAWERLIRSVKRAMRAVLSKQVLRPEALQTLLVEVTHTVNSRPLTHVSIDPRDPEAISPNDLLIGKNTDVVPSIEKMKVDLKRQWIISQQFADNFWRRWIKEYRPTITHRTKWQKNHPNVRIDDLAILIDDSLPRNAWPMGRVAAVYPGRDGIVRVVDIKTIYGTYRRPVSKLCILDVRDE